jgi:hypothetical protein
VNDLDIWETYGFTVYVGPSGPPTQAEIDYFRRSTWQQIKDRLLYLERQGLL